MNTNDWQDRRLAPRHDVSVPIRYRRWKSVLPERYGESLNISEGGMYFVTHFNVDRGETVELRFEMPEAVANEPGCEWLCTGHVVRTKPIGGVSGLLCVGVRFDCYKVAKPEGTTLQAGTAAFRFG